MIVISVVDGDANYLVRKVVKFGCMDVSISMDLSLSLSNSTSRHDHIWD